MKIKKALKIICVVVAVLFGLTVFGGIVYGTLSVYRKQSNDSCAVAECADSTFSTGTQSNYKELSTVKSTAVPYADTATTVTTTKGSCCYTVYAPEEAFPITLYGYNGTSKKSTVVNNNGDTISVVTYWYRDSVTNQIRVVAQGSISYFYAVDCNGTMLFIDFSLTDDSTAFPINASGLNDMGNDPISCIGFRYEPNSKPSNVYAQGLEQGYDNGYRVGYDEATEIEWQRGYDSGVNDGYDTGYSAGYSYGSSKGYDTGFEEGELQGYQNGHSAGYKDGLVDGENKGLSLQLTNPISSFLQPVHDFMNTRFFGDLTYSAIFNVMLFVAVALIFLKMFSGG